MTKKRIKLLCGAAALGGFLVANYASQHSWPMITITLAGVVFIGAVVTYIITMQP